MKIKSIVIILSLFSLGSYVPSIKIVQETNNISNILIYFEKNTAILNPAAKEFLDRNVDSLRYYKVYNKYSLLVQSIECKEEYEQDSLIGMKRRMAVYQYIKDRFFPDTLPIFIDEWQTNWSRNVDPCTGAGVFIKLVPGIKQLNYPFGNLTNAAFPTFFIPFEAKSSEPSLNEKTLIHQYVDSVYSRYFLPKYTFVVYSVECESELLQDSLIGFNRKQKIIRTMKEFSKQDIWLNVYMDNSLFTIDDSSDCNSSGVYIARLEVEGY